MQTLARVALLSAVIALASGPAPGQIRLQSRTLQPSADTTAEFLKALKATPGNALHGMATFSRIPSDEERAQLEKLGIAVLAPFQGTHYRVRVEKRLDLRALRRMGLAVKLTSLAPEDRVAPPIWRGDFAKYATHPRGGKPGNYVLTAAGTLKLTVRMHGDIGEAESRTVLQKHAVSYSRRSSTAWNAVVARASLRGLAEVDAVQWIGPGPMPVRLENDLTRAEIGVDALQTLVDSVNCAVQGVTGNNVQIGIFDYGMDNGHADLVNSVIRKDYSRKGAHATHEGATVAGSGVRSTGGDSVNNPNGGTTPCQWRGMAPGAKLIDANHELDVDPGTFHNYIVTGVDDNDPATTFKFRMDLSNHSYEFSADGDYTSDDADHDAFIRGDGLSGSTPIPARLRVTSAGNNGQYPAGDTGNQLGYFSISKQTKNALVVGNWDRVAGRIDEFSSLGPAHDGRIKPDVVAPGRTVPTGANPVGGLKSAGYCSLLGSSPSPLPECITAGTPVLQNFYTLYRGTSMASAVTTGAVALVLEQYATTYGVDLDTKPPLPSTLRGVMIHSATDKTESPTPWSLSNEDGAVHAYAGPDLATGWGMINAQDAVNVVVNRYLVESKLPTGCGTETYVFTVPPGATGTIRITLAWDDVAAGTDTPHTDPKLINDLDLVLTDPSGTKHYPWQLNQKILDSAGNEIPNQSQTCGTPITVQRQFMPVPNPRHDGAGSSSNINETVTAATPLQAIQGGRDHLNNVEVVDAPAIAGTWIAEVSGFNVPLGPQSYSLIGNTLTKFIVYPPNACTLYPALCPTLRTRPDVCARYPKICATRISFPERDRIRVGFPDLSQKIVLPLDLICRYAINCPVCDGGALCSNLDLQLKTTGAALQAAIYSSSGRLVRQDAGASRSKRLRFNIRRGEQYFIMLGAGQGTRVDTDYDVRMQLR